MADVETWTVYDHPSDFPDLFIARKYINGLPTEEIYAASDLSSIRNRMNSKDMYCLGRFPFDDPVIVETWIN